MSAPLPALVSTDWLAARLGRPGLRVVDGSVYLPTSGRNPAAEYADAHIPGAVFFDVDATSDASSPLPHMLPPAEAFARRMAALGLDDDDDIVVYDGSGVNLSAPRVWWTFRVFGHPRVAVLDGGFGKWRREGRPVESGNVTAVPGRFSARLDPSAVRDRAAVLAGLSPPGEQVVDMRSAGRFAGTEPEPRAGLRGGHIPGSRNLPFNELVAADGTLLPPEALRGRLAQAGVDPARPIVATCGSGTSACALIFALHVLGHDTAVLYDGSWTEWGGRADTPVATGMA
jgi:thiosulfate/3-mercaptopyruvate sulfurtransferase